jgi:hypothetical protein
MGASITCVPEARLDWAKANVSDVDQTLTVPFGDALPDGWGAEFKSLATRREAEIRDAPWGRIDLVEWNQIVQVDDVPEDSVDDLKASLERLVDQANRNLRGQRERLEEQRAQEGREQQERQQRTSRMQDRFRGSTSWRDLRD